MKRARLIAVPSGIVTAFAAAVALLTFPAASREISSGEAGAAATAWVRRDSAPLGMALSTAGVAEVRTASGGGAALFHVVRLAGGGVVVTSAESGVTPIIAFLDGGDIEETAGNPLWSILNADMSNRVAQVQAVRAAEEAKGARVRLGAAAASGAASPFAAEEAAWAELLGERSAAPAKLKSGSIADASGISDLRVPALLATSWDQSNGAGNYYTPPNVAGNADNYPCGCVALAGAQIAKRWQFPVESRPQVTRACYVNGTSANYMTMGGTYDWANMSPIDFYSAPLSDAQRQAVGRLCYDFGVATQMDWGPGGSATAGLMLSRAFTEVFGYANAMAYYHAEGNVITDSIFEKAILANLDAESPVVLGIYGHAVVADGYGYSSQTLYTHLNFGWSGLANAWYNLPVINVNLPQYGLNYSSSVLREVIYNIFPQETGDLLTGRVLDSGGNPVSGATVTAMNGSTTVTGTTNVRGIYALHVAGGRIWTVTATSGGASGSCSANVAASSSAVFTRTVNGSSISDCGTVGNCWGVDIVLGIDSSGGEPSEEPSTGYDSWATANGLGGPEVVTGGQPNLIRYVFNVPSGEFSPITGVTFQDGAPVLLFHSFNPDVSGVALSVLSTTNLLDWTQAENILLPVPPFYGIVFTHPDNAPSRFYKLKVEQE